jgi:GNAT superfamily N-acetyltransferase
VELRVASDDELDAWVAVWNETMPSMATTAELQRQRRERDQRRLNLLALEGDAPVGCGWAGPSDAPSSGSVSPRVLPHARRRGIGTALLRRLCAHVGELGFARTGSRVMGGDAGSLEFGRRFGFEEVNRQLEQIRELGGDEAEPVPPPGVTFVSVEERPELLPKAYELGAAGWGDMVTPVPVTISLDDWLRDEATYPGGSFVALAGGEIVGYSGLCRTGEDGVAEDGLTVVRRDWRRRGLATALKRAELAWAAQNGIRRVETWTQTGNEGMRAVNERLGFRYGIVEIDLARGLPLEAP